MIIDLFRFSVGCFDFINVNGVLALKIDTSAREILLTNVNRKLIPISKKSYKHLNVKYFIT